MEVFVITISVGKARLASVGLYLWGEGTAGEEGGGGGRREEHVRAWWSAIRPEGRRSGGEPASAHGYSTMER